MKKPAIIAAIAALALALTGCADFAPGPLPSSDLVVSSYPPAAIETGDHNRFEYDGWQLQEGLPDNYPSLIPGMTYRWEYGYDIEYLNDSPKSSYRMKVRFLVYGWEAEKMNSAFFESGLIPIAEPTYEKYPDGESTIETFVKSSAELDAEGKPLQEWTVQVTRREYNNRDYQWFIIDARFSNRERITPDQLVEPEAG